MRERCDVICCSARLAMLLGTEWDLIETHRLFQMLIVIPSCFSEFNLEKCGVHRLNIIAKFWKWLCGGKEFYIHYPQVEICPNLHSWCSWGKYVSQIHCQHFNNVFQAKVRSYVVFELQSKINNFETWPPVTLQINHLSSCLCLPSVLICESHEHKTTGNIA